MILVPLPPFTVWDLATSVLVGLVVAMVVVILRDWYDDRRG